MQNVYPQWHRKRYYGSDWDDINKYRKLDLRQYEYQGKAIPKGGGESRYLGTHKNLLASLLTWVTADL